MEFHKISWAAMAVLTMIAACHSHKTPQVTAQDVEAAKQDVSANAHTDRSAARCAKIITRERAR